MGCALLLLLLGAPRLALFFVWILRDGYLSAAYETSLWPILGFFFLPVTTLAFAYGMNSLGAPGEMTSLGWLLTGVGLLIDLGFTGGGARSARNQNKD